MARDYKPRVREKKSWHSRSESRHKSGNRLWNWLLLITVVILLVVGLVYLVSFAFKKDDITPTNSVVTEQSKDAKTGPEVKPQPVVDVGPKVPQFDFYTILPDKEVVVPEYEIKTRAREERMGKAKEAHYVIQAGSFKTSKEAEQLQLKLATMGIVSKIDKSKLGDVNWYRVKMGPYTQTSIVNTIRSRLRQNGIDILITEHE